MAPLPPGPSPDPLALGPDEVHVWRARLPAAAVARRAPAGDDGAAVRAEAARARFGAGRDLLRAVLAAYLGADPAGLRFTEGPHGKPALAPPHDALRFNLSHADDRALVAVARGREVGVDVERVHPPARADALAPRTLSARERAALAALPEGRRAAAFAAAWTRKEAFVKALGRGLAFGLGRFSVALTGPARLVETPWDPAEAARWTLRALAVGPGYRAAVAAEGHGLRVVVRTWPPGGQSRNGAFSSSERSG